MTDDCVLAQLLAAPATLASSRESGERLGHDEVVRIADLVAEIVVDRLHVLGPGRVWLSVREIVERGSGSRVVVISALQGGSLHGHQATKGGHWRAHVAAVDAWVRGASAAAQAKLCGCEWPVDRTSAPRRRQTARR